MSSLSANPKVNEDAVIPVSSDHVAATSAVEVNSYMVLGTRFDIESRYSILDSVGQGAYGIVCAARDDVADTVVAIKDKEKSF